MKFLSNNLVYIYTLLWMLYYLQHMFMLRGIIAQSILATVIVISFYAFLKVTICFKEPVYLKWLSIMLLILTIYGVIPIIDGEVIHKNGYVNSVSDNYFYLQTIYQSILPIFAFYYFTLKKQMTSKTLNILFLFILLSCILIFYQKYNIASVRMNREEVTNNIGYYFVPLIPMLYIIKIRNLWKYIFLIISFFFIMMSVKRGAILVGTFAMISFVIFQLRKVQIKQVLYIVSLSAVALYTVYKYVMNLYDSSAYFRVRLERTLEGDSSGRDRIYMDFLNYFTDKSTLMEFLIGHGAAGTVKEFGGWAHNDWLEFAIDFGVLGIILYLVYWCLFVYEWWNYCGPIECKRTMRDCIIIYFLITLFSMSINNMPIAATLCIGYCLAKNGKNNNIDYADK